jgi:YD repeat-containing protein
MFETDQLILSLVSVLLRRASVGALALAAIFFNVALAQDVQPIPSFYQDPGLSPNRDYVNQQMNEHIDPFTGKLQLHYVDLFIPGNGGLDIKVQRSYNSINELLTEPTVLGVGWTMHFGRVLRNANIGICDTNQGAVNAPVLELPDGSRQILYLSLDNSYVLSTNRWRGVCAASGTGLTVTSPEGVVYQMTYQGQAAGTSGVGQQNAFYVSTMTDRNGNTLTFAYVAVGASTSVSTITASDGRQVTFQYGATTLTSISDGTRTWNYTYTFGDGGSNYPFLTQVQRPDGQSWQYGYNLVNSNNAGTYSMNSVTYPTGGTYTYQYGFVSFNVNLPRTTVLTQKTSSVDGSWTYAYTPASMMADFSATSFTFPSPAMLDQTVVTAPDGVYVYAHVGANSVESGAIYAIGLLMYKLIGNSTQEEVYSWDNQVISNTPNIRPGAPLLFDNVTVAPITVSKSINRDGQGYQTQYSNFDTYGNVGTTVETGTSVTGVPDTRTTQMTYAVDPVRWFLHLPSTKTVDIVPGTIAWTYDTNANVLAKTQYGVTTQYTYTPTGDIASKTDALGNVTNYSTYVRGIPQTENQPEGVTIQRVVDVSGNITSQTDGAGVTTGYAYDGLNRLTAIVHPVGNPVSITWLSNERDVQRGSYLETSLFDAYGRLSSVQHSGGSGITPITQSYLYDPLGRRIFTSYPNQSVGVAKTYDMLGRTTATMYVATPAGPTGVFSVAGGQSTTTYYLNQHQFFNERGIEYVSSFRAYGDPDEAELVEYFNQSETASQINLSLNGLGQPLQITQGGQTRTNTYNANYFLVQSTDPEVGTTVFGRDAVGNMISRQVGSSGTTAYAYDGRNRLTTVTYPSSTLGTPTVTKTYYLDDLLESVSTSLAQRNYTYGLNKLMSQETLTVGGQVLSASYAYDPNDALQSTTYSTGLVLTYNPDPLGRPTQALPFATAIGYFPSGHLQSLQFANGTSTVFSLNPRLWPNGMNLTAGNGAAALNMSYVYDNTGNVLSISEPIAGLHTRTFGYDASDRLTNVTMPGVTGGTITYDPLGNITSQAIGTNALSYQYDPSTNRLLSVTGSEPRSFTYDAYGNVSGNGAHQFTYDDALAMRCVDCGTANEIDYVYDGAGTRVSQLQGGVTTYFMYGHGGDLLFEVDSTGVKREYGYVAGKNIAKRESP